MLHWLQAAFDWIFRRSSLVQFSLHAPNADGLSRNRRQVPDPPKRPYDPDSWVRAPKGYAPTDRSSSVAVAEPVDDESVVAVGGRNSHTALVIHGSGDDGYGRHDKAAVQAR